MVEDEVGDYIASLADTTEARTYRAPYRLAQLYNGRALRSAVQRFQRAVTTKAVTSSQG